MENNEPSSSTVPTEDRLIILRDHLVQAFQSSKSDKFDPEELIQGIDGLVTELQRGATGTSASSLRLETAIACLQEISSALPHLTESIRRRRGGGLSALLSITKCRQRLPALTLNDLAPETGGDSSQVLNNVRGSSETTAPSPAERDCFLTGLRTLLKTGSRTASMILPGPAGKIIQDITDTGVGIIDVLENVENNMKDAMELGGYVASLVQAILQFLPANKSPDLVQKLPNTNEDIDLKEVVLTNALKGFLQTLKGVADGLQQLREQGRFRKMFMAKANQIDMKGFNRDIQYAFNKLQVQLQLRMLRSIDGIEYANMEQQRRWLLDRLHGSDNGAQEKAADESDLLCLDGTRREVLQDIYDWVRGSPTARFLWLNGVAGCGKTAVAATVHHHLKSLSITSAIFYCTAGNQTRCASVVRSLALWLARSSSGSLERYMLEAIRTEQDIATLPLSSQVALLLEKPLSVILPNPHPVVLIIDALDEWYDTKKASSLVALLANMSSSTTVKILITSRDEKHIKLAFSKAARDAVRNLELDAVPPQHVERDLEAYVKTRLAELHEHHGLAPDWPGPTRMRALVDKSEHLFQFAATALRYIQLGYPPVALDEVLDGPASSETLKDLYLAILRRVFSDSPTIANRKILKHVLICLVCAPVPVSLDIIADLWNDARNMDSATKRSYIRTSVLDHLGSFLVVSDDPKDSIRFLHTSIVDFFIDPARRDADARFHVDTTEGHLYLATVCLERMSADLSENMFNIESYTAHISEVQTAASAVAAGLSYSAVHWVAHLEVSTPDATLIDLLETFALTDLLHWIELLAFLGSVLSVGHPAARKAQAWCLSHPAASTLTSLFYDTFRFIGQFHELLSSHPLLCYKNLISFAAQESELYKLYGPNVKNCVKVVRGPSQTKWHARHWKATHGGSVYCIAISPNGLIVASGGDDTKIRLWDAASGMQVGNAFEGHSKAVQSLAFTPDGRTLVSASENIRLWDVETGQEKDTSLIGHTGVIYSVSISPDGSLLASGSADGTIRLWDMKRGAMARQPLNAEAGGVLSVAFYPDGLTLVCGCKDGSVQRWDTRTGLPVGETMKGHSREVWSVCISPNGETIASGSYAMSDREVDSVRLWDAKTGVQIGAPLKRVVGGLCVAFSPDNNTIAAGTQEQIVRMWDARTRRHKPKMIYGSTSSVHALAFAPDGNTIISGAGDGTVRAWDAQGVDDEGRQAARDLGHAVASVAFSPDAKFIASKSTAGRIGVWSAQTGLLVGKIESRNETKELKFSLSGRVLKEVGWKGCEWDVSGAKDGTGGHIQEVEPGTSEVFPDLGVEKLEVDSRGWIERDGRKWLWLPEPGPPVTSPRASCYLLGSTLVVQQWSVPIIDVAALL